jgi:hypothetical protein
VVLDIQLSTQQLLTPLAVMVDLQQVAVEQVLLVMVLLQHQILLVVQVVQVVVAVVAVVALQVAQVAQEYFTFSTRRQL